MRAEIAYLVTHILEGTIEDGQGTGKGAQDFTRDKSGTIVRPAAGKTGTTENCIDAWFVAYTPDLAAAVWVGYDDNSSLGDRMTGGRVACPIWTQFMLEAAGKKPAKSFERPDNITFVQVDRDTGKRASFDTPEANVVLEAYVRGTEPRSASAS
jgi:penicillin-binding protein 1A